MKTWMKTRMKTQMKTKLAAAILLLAGTPAFAHRLDEYLQSTIFSVEKNRLSAEITLTPGVAVFPIVMAEIDTDADGVISAAEQQAYARRVLGDLSLKMDDSALTPRLLSWEFPSIAQMKGGLGAIRIEFEAALPHGALDRKLVFENHHLSRIAAYQVNCLVPGDPDIRIVGQNRNYIQSFYELDYVQPGVRSDLLRLAWPPGAREPLGAVAILLLAWLALLWRQRALPLKSASATWKATRQEQESYAENT